MGKFLTHEELIFCIWVMAVFIVASIAFFVIYFAKKK